MIISGKGIRNHGSTKGSFTTVLDIAPTIYELAGIEPSQIGYPLAGKSLQSMITHDVEQIHDSAYVYGVEHINKAFLRKGHWKIVSHEVPFRKENFELYNLQTDLSESTDLKNQYPEKFEELLQEWNKFSEERRIQNPYPGNEEF